MPQARYLQLADFLKKKIQQGDFPPGTQLPPHRLFAEQQGVALATATRAYKLLEQQGWIIGETGRGMFVRDQAIDQNLGLAQAVDDGLVDLVFNMPGESSDAEILRSGLKKICHGGDLAAMLRYQPHGGRPYDRHVIAQFLTAKLGLISEEDLLLTSGAQHALAIIAGSLCQAGDKIITDPLTYPGIKAVAGLHHLDLVPIGSSAGHGSTIDPEKIEEACRRQKIKALYLMPTVHNPLGNVMPLADRLKIAQIAETYNLLILEDSAYAFLEDTKITDFISLIPERVLHIGSFSKNLATGLRLGYLIAPQQCHLALIQAIRATSWNVPALITTLVSSWVLDGTINDLEKKRRKQGQRQQLLCRRILQDFTQICHPAASFTWLPLETGKRTEQIVAALAAEGIAVSGASPYIVGSAEPQAIRLAFGGLEDDRLIAALDKIKIILQADPD